MGGWAWMEMVVVRVVEDGGRESWVLLATNINLALLCLRERDVTCILFNRMAELMML